VSVRDIGNKLFSTLAIMIIYSNITLLVLAVIDINDFNIGNYDNYNNVRGCIMSPSKPSLRTVSISSSEALVDYTTQMEQYNNLPDNDEVGELIDRSQLFYVEGKKEDNPVSEITNSSISREQQYVNNGDPALSKATNSNKHVFNM